jgi:hypothetical protein
MLYMVHMKVHLWLSYKSVPLKTGIVRQLAGHRDGPWIPRGRAPPQRRSVPSPPAASSSSP